MFWFWPLFDYLRSHCNGVTAMYRLIPVSKLLNTPFHCSISLRSWLMFISNGYCSTPRVYNTNVSTLPYLTYHTHFLSSTLPLISNECETELIQDSQVRECWFIAFSLTICVRNRAELARESGEDWMWWKHLRRAQHERCHFLRDVRPHFRFKGHKSLDLRDR